MSKDIQSGSKLKLSPTQRALLLNIQGGCELMWSYKEHCFWRYDGKWTVKVLKSAANGLFKHDLIDYKATGRHEGVSVERYKLTELGKSITL
jgi:hypothetical protein